ncbi:MAG: Type 2 DNA topoisomerase 6 subunit B [Planctomycetes bacterium]|nr:Type 2 DNA topoisomerase 6 subunit B [Planctomycetota bacterium]
MADEPKKRRTAEEMADAQREISVSEFFVKNRHLLGFDNPLKALLTAVKEGVDNALDACEEAAISPEITVEITRAGDLGTARPAPEPVPAAAAAAGTPEAKAAPATKDGDRLFQATLFDAESGLAEIDDAAKASKEVQKAKGRKVTDPPERFVVAIEDNGPGIVPEQIGKVFGKLLYGSKFHRLRQSLTGDQPVLVERADRAAWTTIGELVDGLLPAGAEVADVSACGIRAPAFDRTTGRVAWRDVSHVIRHPRANEVIEVRTENGKSVRVTGCHSLFTFDPSAPRGERFREVEARALRPGDHVIAPSRLPRARRVSSVSLLDAVTAGDLRARQCFVYGLDAELLASLVADSVTVAKRDAAGRSRRHLRLRPARGGRPVDVLEESWAQYASKGFLPAWIVLELGIAAQCRGARLRTYFHGRACETPVTWELTPALMRFLGLWTAEGHADRRQAAFTFSSAEKDLVEEVVATAASLSLSTSIEERDGNAVRVKVFGGLLDLVLPAWCGRGAKRKRAPWFAFSADAAERQAYLDGLHLGDGHRVAGRDVLMLTTTSDALLRDAETLWLMQGAVPSRRGPYLQQGLGRHPSRVWHLEIHGSDIATSQVFAPAGARGARPRSRMFPAALLGGGAEERATRVRPEFPSLVRAAGLGAGPAGPRKAAVLLRTMEQGIPLTTAAMSSACGARVTAHLPERMAALGLMEPWADRDGTDPEWMPTPRASELRDRLLAAEEFGRSDLCLLRVTSLREVEDAGAFVYDLSVPGCENFVAGHGAIACHNSRGQQGIGISAAGMYGQLTTGKPVRITSRTGKKKPAIYVEVALDLQRNQPDIRAQREVEWGRPQGTRVEIELEAKHQRGRQSVDTWLRATALANPHATIRYRDPEGEWRTWERATRSLPAEPREIMPHPNGVELGMLLQMLKVTENKKLGAFLENEFSRVSRQAALAICEASGLNPTTWVARVAREEATKLHAALAAAKLMNPPTDCVSPIGEGLLVDSLQREYPKAFIRAVTRSPSVYRGNPFLVEAAVAYDPTSMPAEEPMALLRFANRVPLLYQQGACAVTKAVLSVPWKSYHVQQSKGALPTGPIVLAVHLASVWVPFTSEAKEAVASYPEILKEIRLAVMDCGRSLGVHISKHRRAADEQKKRDYIAKYIPKISEALQKILEFDGKERDRTTAQLTDILNRSRTQ